MLMIELTVMFQNQSMDPLVLLTGPFGEGDPIEDGVKELRTQAETQLTATLEDEQCFYRFFRKDE